MGRSRRLILPIRSTKLPKLEDYITTTFTFDAANQLVSSTAGGVTTRYAYDAAGRLVREGSKTYRYGRIFENDLWVGQRYLITHQWEGIKHKWQGIIE